MADTQADFKWFGDGFDGFPKRLPDDCVKYSIYILDETLQDPEVRERLRGVLSAATTLTKKLLKDFIWQRESFGLDLVREGGISYLHGRTNYGDSIEDEWLIVYILQQLSSQRSDIWIRIVDTDGEFLLIEAANSLPNWLNPEIADNRVWLNSGQLFIIPLLSKQAESKAAKPDPRPLALKEAFSFMREDRSKLLQSPLIEAEAFYRLRNYPQQINDSLHNARAIVPRNLAYLLHQNAAYISPAVEAFYLRDPIALRPLQAHNQEHMKFPPTDMVTITVKFTKVGYAQLRSQRFSTPSTWAETLAATERQSISQLELGIKVACGFEMLLSDPQNQDKRVVREMKIILEDVRKGEDQLPSDLEISTWKVQEDDDSWMDINFEDFDRELAGRGRPLETGGDGFGDKTAQENLRKMVARFEDFLNDDAAGSNGAEFVDDMDNDDDSDLRSTSSSSEGEDKEVSFDEEEFRRMMSEMMGMPAGADLRRNEPSPHASADDTLVAQASIMAESNDDKEAEEDEDIRRLTEAMEVELRAAGALQLEEHQTTAPKLKDKDSAAINAADSEEGSDGDQELDIDFNLAKNMLESFKSQAGMAGPGGNLMGMMGMQLPRDEDDGGPEGSEISRSPGNKH